MTNGIITFLASFLIWFMFAGLFVLWLTDGKIKREQVLHALVAAGVAWAVAQIIKGIFPTERPFQVNGFLPLTVTTPTDGAFPSGHTAAAFAIAVTIWLHDKKVGIFYLLGAVTLGVARVLGNVHYPVDIFGGAVLGSLVSLAFEKLHVRKIFRA